MNWTVQYAEYYLYRGVSRTNAYEFMQQSGRSCVREVQQHLLRFVPVWGGGEVQASNSRLAYRG